LLPLESLIRLTPVGRVYYSFSTFLCVPNALAQDGGYSLGAQAGAGPLARLASDVGLPVSAGWPRRRSTSSTRPAAEVGPAAGQKNPNRMMLIRPATTQ
jgi:hypothetical protein